MFRCSTFFDTKDKALIECAIHLLKERVFDNWQIQPVFTVENVDEEDFMFIFEYETKTENEVKNGHAGMDLACTFIDGFLQGAKKGP